MARVTTQQRRYKYPIGTGQRALSHRDIGVLTAEEGAIAELADLGGLIATQIGRKIYIADAKAQAAEGIAEIDKGLNAEFDSYDTRPDYSTYKESFDKTLEGFNGLINNKTNEIAKNRIREYITKNKPKWEKARNKAVLGRMQIGLLDSRDRILGSIKDLDLTDPSALAEAEGRIGAAGNLMKEHGGFSDDAVGEWTEYALKEIDNQEIYQSAQKIMAESGLDEAVEFVMKQGIETEAKRKIVGDINFEAAQQKRRKEVRQEKDRDEISKLIRSGESAEESIESSSLNESEQWAWFERERVEVERRIKGVLIAIDQPELRRLKDLIPDLWRDRISYNDVAKQITDARYPVDGLPKIDDKAYDDLFDQSRTELKRVQAESIGDIMRAVKGELNVPEQNVMAAMMTILQGEERQIYQSTVQQQSERANSFEEAMRDWLKENPTATRDEFEKFKADNLPYFRSWEPGMPLAAEQEIPSFSLPVLDRSGKTIGMTKPFVVESMKKPESIEEFKAKLKSMPNRDARNHYYLKWSDIVYKEAK